MGKVETIEFIPIENRHRSQDVLKITMSINVAVQQQIRGDSEARVRTQGLLGDKVIDLTPGSPEAPALTPGDTVPSAIAVDYEQMLASAAELVDDLSVMLRNMRSIADNLLAGHGTAGRMLMDTTLYAEMLSASRSMTEFLESVGDAEGAFAQLAQDDRLYQDLRSVVAGLDTLTMRLVDGDGTLSRLITDDSLYVQLVSTSARADSMLSAIESGEGTLGQLVTDQDLYESLLKLLVDVQAVVLELREDPRKYVPPIRVF